MAAKPKGMTTAVWALILVAGFSAPPAPAAGRLVSARVSEPFEVAGQLFEPGRLSLHEVQSLSPVATLTEVRVAGRSLGIIVAREQTASAIAARSEVIFERSPHGHLILAALALEGQTVKRLEPLVGGETTSREPATPPARGTLVASVQ